ncbi:MAG: conjugal transfer protein TraM [Sedimenticola sp.]|uniref:Conjugal transfer protein TraM n=1 Tax=Shewanella indica TaxID=768528 RepID=A0ABU4QGS3_9GAMM|nr:conjugal transfer protein TraM [Shewanella indica]MDX6018617.1 conjugal transfer protein TraM [Shewanella indica]MDX6018656.1 conjugal transfer protein TraM [Shewanella indica]PLY11766.1 MAG: conjugal transfer protein TraM [Sedimenticola sp.]
MTDKIEETIKEIAAKHGIAVGRDDPILVLQTINERLMQDSAAAQQEILDRFKEELESIAHRWGDDAKSKAERMLNAALTASKEAMASAMKEGATAATVVIQKEIKDAVLQIRQPIGSVRAAATMNIVAAVMTLLAAGVVLWAAG